MVINPGTQTGNCLIGLKIGDTWSYISKTAPVGGFLRGKKYVVEIHTADAIDSPPIDGDGNVYNTVTIGTQTWMAENLKTTKYNDNTPIPNVTDNSTWHGLTTGAYCWYDNNETTYKATYGALYNWFAVDNNAATRAASNGGKNICPTGWHVPADTEWTTLTNYLGGTSAAGAKLKETGTVHWAAPNTEATNSTGFTALPQDYRFYDGLFKYNNPSDGYWWSFTTNYGNPYFMVLYSSNSHFEKYECLKTFGYSVRCLKDMVL